MRWRNCSRRTKADRQWRMLFSARPCPKAWSLCSSVFDQEQRITQRMLQRRNGKKPARPILISRRVEDSGTAAGV